MWLGFRPWNPPRVANLPFQTPSWSQAALSFDPWVTAAVVVTIATSAWWTWYRVRRGGSAVAERVGGRAVAPDTRDPAEVRLQHVVEEMAIASGLPAPAAYVLDGQAAVNAFAAGHSIEDAAMAVTAGALEKLDRDELQALVAHEMSHILNGDSRINLRMMCLVGGLTGVETAGSWLCVEAWRGTRKSTLVSVPFRLAIFASGAALRLVGWLGVAGSRLVKAAVSRQREFLADASAVQFTRNPVALGRALRKTAAGTASVSGAHVEEVSHMFFAREARARVAKMFETHPSIEERLAAIEPVRAASPAPVPRAPSPPALAHARAVHSRIPAATLQFARTPSAARGVVGGVLLHADAGVREAQVKILSSLGAPDVVEAAFAAADCIRGDPDALRLALVDLALPALGRLPREDKRRFLDGLRAVVETDRQRWLFEFSVVALVEACLQPSPSSDRVQFTTVAQVSAEAAHVLWLLARSGSRAPAQVEAAWNAGVSRLGGRSASLPTTGARLAPVEVDERLLPALAKLRTLAPAAKKQLLEALAACAMADGAVTFAETDVLRAVSAAIGSPLPPQVTAREPVRLVSEAGA
jgi:Zn-dependent protease with chaperone function